jgi:hypothetical protein
MATPTRANPSDILIGQSARQVRRLNIHGRPPRIAEQRQRHAVIAGAVAGPPHLGGHGPRQ